MRDRRMKFLMGLNDAYITSRSNILQMKPSLSLKECYKQLVQNETQRRSKQVSLPEVSALYAGQTSDSSQSNSQSFGGSNRQSARTVASNKNRKALFCTYCQLQGLVRETCYKLHGYPPGYKFTTTTRQITLIIEAVEVLLLMLCLMCPMQALKRRLVTLVVNPLLFRLVP
ncbi:hypothetical protein QQ045_014079 [Rhodiola kirilowii]